MRSRFLFVAVLAGCGSSEATPNQDVSVELASVTLGDECGFSNMPHPKKADADARRSGDSDAACQQTSMQIAFKAAKTTTIKVKKVELLDDKGKLLELLTAKQPSKWGGKKYIAWNESLASGETLQTSYMLSSPDWNKHTKGRRNAHTKKLQVRVTLAVGAQNRTFEKQATIAAYIEPDVDT